MKIGLDFDGVISDTSKLKSLGAKMFYNLDISAEESTRDIIVRKKKLLTHEQYLELQHSVSNNRKIGLLMSPVRYAIYYIRKLIASGHSISVITTRNGIALEIAEEWFSRKMPEFKVDFVGIDNGNSKLKSAIGLDVFIDDTFEVLEELLGFVPNLYLFLWNYNLEDGFDSRIQRVSSWKEIYKIINDLEGNS
ncbi:MAG: hypothetical protein PHH83_00925 [Patescibacteria group bacterium]|nr:hypothetical protein [Patescibacteria group bacterium]